MYATAGLPSFHLFDKSKSSQLTCLPITLTHSLPHIHRQHSLESLSLALPHRLDVVIYFIKFFHTIRSSFNY